MIFTYLLKSRNNGTFYVGISKEPDDRLVTHNAGLVITTKSKRPWALVYQQPHQDYVEARKHEKWLKKKNHEYKNALAGKERQKVVVKVERKRIIVRDWKK